MMICKSFAWNLMLCAFVWLGIGSRECRSHPFHTSLIEMDWNAQTGCWEVGMRVLASDLEVALQRNGSPIPLLAAELDSSEFRERIRDYLSLRFYLIESTGIALGRDDENRVGDRAPLNESSARGVISTLRWIGAEDEGAWVWLYFELAPSISRSSMVLVLRVLADVNPDQMNILSVRFGRSRRSVQFQAESRIFLSHASEPVAVHVLPDETGG